MLGPGLVTGAADDDPSGIATYSQAGARFGYGLLWTMLLTFPLMAAVQLVSAHIGRVTGHGLAKNMGDLLPRSVVTVLVAMVFVANTFNIGADLAAMGAAGALVTGINAHLMTMLFAAVSLLLQLMVPYGSYSRFLKWLTLVLFAYVAVVFAVHIDWMAVMRGLVWPSVPDRHAATLIVAIFGTTISPYLFFWQSAQEVEEMTLEHSTPLFDAPWQARRAFLRIGVDTWAGMAFSNLIALAIMVATAATLNVSGMTDITTAAQAAQALRPVAGQFAFLLFSIGIIGTGMLAAPILAGSAAYAVGESRSWNVGLDYKPWQATGFYAVIVLATVIGLMIDWSPLDPIKALFWSAVINGVVAVPIIAAMMIVVSRHSAMGKFTATGRLKVAGWTATAVMASAAIAMFVLG
jgi:NRAMP (natural resistance-associated macrophage protein)-like metal ion transporter